METSYITMTPQPADGTMDPIDENNPERRQFTSSPELIVLARIGPYRLTKQAKHDDFAVWCNGRVTGQGGAGLMNRKFNEIEARYAAPNETQTEDDDDGQGD